MKKFLAGILSVSMLVSATLAFAAAPADYDGKAYPAGVTSNDPDGQMNLAVISNGDVKIYGDAMYIEGSVYSNGTIYGGNGDGNVIKGVFVSGTENQTETGAAGAVAIRYGYVHVDDDGNTDVTNAYSTGLKHDGAILDKETSFDYSYTPYTYPEIDNYVETMAANRYRSVANVSEDIHIGTLTDVNGAGFIIDATEKDITVVIDKVEVAANPFIQVVGDHHVSLYVKNWVQNNGANVNLELAVTDGDYSNWDLVDQWASNQYPIFAADANGIPRPKQDILEKLNPSQIDLYIDAESGVINLDGAKIAANIHSNAETLQVGMSAEIYGNIESGASSFETIGSGYINGKVIVPNAASTIHNSSCIQGQLITDTLLINGAGAILNQTDSIVVNGSPSDDDQKGINLDIVEDVIYVVAGDNYTVNVNHSGPYTWQIVYDETTYQPSWDDFSDADGMIYILSGDTTPRTKDQLFGKTVKSEWWTPTGEMVLKAVSTEDGSVYDTVKIIVVASEDDIPDTEPTPAPADPTPTPDVPGDEIDLNGLGYAYIFGYEPETVKFDRIDENGNTVTVEYTPIYMAPDDSVTREQVAAMLMRMVDQTAAAKDAKYTMTPNIAAWEGQWFARGFAYLAGKGTFDGIDYVGMGSVTRGEVAKLVAYGLNLSNTTETAFTDIDGNEYKQYIEIMNAYGYMNGTSDTEFEPNRVMTRAEFCSMFNNIIGRTNMGLTTAEGKTVTAEDYSIVDIDGHWAYETMLKATSAYDKDGNVDFEIRQDNIRNKLDNYDSQLEY